VDIVGKQRLFGLTDISRIAVKVYPVTIGAGQKRMALFFGQLRAQGQTVVPQQQRNTSSEVGSAARARFEDQLSALTDAKRLSAQPRTATQFLRGGKDAK
jgi:hypothetical protein